VETPRATQNTIKPKAIIVFVMTYLLPRDNVTEM